MYNSNRRYLVNVYVGMTYKKVLISQAVFAQSPTLAKQKVGHIMNCKTTRLLPNAGRL